MNSSVRYLSHNLFRATARSSFRTLNSQSINSIRGLSSLTGGFTYPAPRKLKDIAKLQLLERHTSEKVSEIWNEYHKTNKSTISDSLHQESYELLQSRSKRCPLFVIPVPRDKGYFTLLLQFQQRQLFFTFLEDYKQNSASAMPYLTITFFEEFLQTKHIALVRADVTNNLTKPESKIIWELVKKFYLGEGVHGFDSVVNFNEKPNQFDFSTVLKASGVLQWGDIHNFRTNKVAEEADENENVH